MSTAEVSNFVSHEEETEALAKMADLRITREDEEDGGEEEELENEFEEEEEPQEAVAQAQQPQQGEVEMMRARINGYLYDVNKNLFTRATLPQPHIVFSDANIARTGQKKAVLAQNFEVFTHVLALRVYVFFEYKGSGSAASFSVLYGIDYDCDLNVDIRLMAMALHEQECQRRTQSANMEAENVHAVKIRASNLASVKVASRRFIFQAVHEIDPGTAQAASERREGIANRKRPRTEGRAPEIHDS